MRSPQSGAGSARRGTRLTGPRVVVPVALLVAGLGVVSGRRVWLTGRVEDAVLGSSTISGTGAQVVPGLVAVSLVLAAAALAAATAGPLLRRLTLAAGLLAAVALGTLSARALVEGDTLLGGLAATASGRTGTIPVAARAGLWPAVLAAASCVAVLALVTGLAGASSWRGLSQRYDAPADPDVAGGRGERVPGTWDRLDRGDDPTEGD